MREEGIGTCLTQLNVSNDDIKKALLFCNAPVIFCFKIFISLQKQISKYR